MIAQLATYLLSRITDTDNGFEWLDKTAGLTRAITYKDKLSGKLVTLPIAADVTNPLECDVTKIDHMLPNDQYKSVLFIECEQFPRTTKSLGIASEMEARFRIVAWLNCARLGGIAGCGSLAYMELAQALETRSFNTANFKSGRIEVIGDGAARGRDIFGKYTMDEQRAQHLHYPFDFFAMEVLVSFTITNHCAATMTADEIACWTQPVEP